MVSLNIHQTAKNAAKAAAEVVAEFLREKPNANFGLGAGNTLIPFYAELVRMYHDREAPFDKFNSFQLDDYLGLPGTHPASFRYYLCDSFFDHVPALRRFQKRLPGLPVSVETTSKKFEQRIKRFGGLDLVVMGLGIGDWIAFNESGSPFDSRTRAVRLTDEIRNLHKADFPRGSVPRRAITMGIGTILDAGKIVVVVTGEHKAKALNNMFTARMSPKYPSTALRKHDNVIVFADKAAASKVPKKIIHQDSKITA